MSVTLDDDDVVHGIGPDGRPDPDYPKALGIVPAPLGLRSLAFALDAFVVLVLTLPLTLGTLPLWFGVFVDGPPSDLGRLFSDQAFVWGLILYGIGELLLIIFLLVQLILHGRRGVTVGKAIVGIRSVNVVRFTRPGFWRMALRGFVFWTSLTIIPILGAMPFLLSPLWDPERRGRGWLDRIGGNWLVDARRGLDPFDTKAMRHARRRLEKPEATPEEQIRSLASKTSGAVPEFVPAARSRSGVISLHGSDDGVEPWSPPPIAEPPSLRVAPPAPPVEATSAQPGAILQFDDGSRVRVAGTGLLGRAPQGKPDEFFDHLLPVTDDSLLISKTHAEFAVDSAGCWIVDRGSVNGVEVTEPSKPARELVPWERELLPWGSTLVLGGRTLTLVSDPETNGGTR